MSEISKYRLGMAQKPAAEVDKRRKFRRYARRRPSIEEPFCGLGGFLGVERKRLLLEEIRRVDVLVGRLELLYPLEAFRIKVDVVPLYEEPRLLEVEHRLVLLFGVFASSHLVQRIAGVLEHVELVGHNGRVRKIPAHGSPVCPPQIRRDDLDAITPLLAHAFEETTHDIPASPLHHANDALVVMAVEERGVDVALLYRNLVDCKFLAGLAGCDGLPLRKEFPVDPAHGLVVQGELPGDGGNTRIVALARNEEAKPVGLSGVGREAWDLLDMNRAAVRAMDPSGLETPKKPVGANRHILHRTGLEGVVVEKCLLSAVCAGIVHVVPPLQVDGYGIGKLIKVKIYKFILGQLTALNKFDKLCIRHMGFSIWFGRQGLSHMSVRLSSGVYSDFHCNVGFRLMKRVA